MILILPHGNGRCLTLEPRVAVSMTRVGGCSSTARRWLQHTDPDYPKRRSAALEAALIVTALVRGGHKTLLFCKVGCRYPITTLHGHLQDRRGGASCRLAW